MSDLILKFTDPAGGDESVEVNRDRFGVGRHSDNDLTITDSRLSREHLLIERLGNEFVVSDRGSANGTKINGEPLTGPKALKDGDRLNLGGFEIAVELRQSAADASADIAGPAVVMGPEPQNVPQSARPAAVHPPDDGGLPKSFFIIAPVLAVVILVVLGVVVYLSGSAGRESNNGTIVYSDDPTSTPTNRKTKTADPGNSDPGDTSVDVNSDGPITPGNTDITLPTPATNPTDTSKTEQNAANFLRKAAQSDPKAFITGEQAQLVNDKIKGLSSASGLADNINSAKKSADQIRTLATAKNLKPQLLAVAALTKLGTTRGDVAGTAQGISEILDKLDTEVGSELGDDCLLMMATFDQGQSGDFQKMRNMLQELVNKTPASARTVRTIWYLKKNGNITDAEYNFALTFLAIGSITQNPHDYGINADPLTF